MKRRSAAESTAGHRFPASFHRDSVEVNIVRKFTIYSGMMVEVGGRS